MSAGASACDGDCWLARSTRELRPRRPGRDRYGRRQPAGLGHGRSRPGQPALVGPRRRRVPGRARRLPRRRPASCGARRAWTRTTPGCSADVARPAGSWRSAAARRSARAGWPRRAPAPVALDLSHRQLQHAAADRRRRAGIGRGAAGAGRRAARCRSRDGSLRPRLLGATARCRSSPTRRAVMREVARVLRPGGRWVFSVTHPMRWAFPDDPGPEGLTVDLVLLRPHAVRRAGRRRAGGLRRAPPHAGRPGPGDRRGRAAAGRPGRAGVAGRTRAGLGRLVAAARRG